MVTLAPLPALLLGALFGSWFSWVALFQLTVLPAALDWRGNPGSPAAVPGVALPTAGRLSAVLAAVQLAVLAVTVGALSGITGLHAWDRLVLLIAAALYLGQVGVSAAMELARSDDPRRAAQGRAVLATMLAGHRVGVERLIHQPRVGTSDDPLTARLGDGFWGYLVDAWQDSLRGGWEIETGQAAAAGLPASRHPWLRDLAASGAAALAALLLGGLLGLIVWIVLCAAVHVQILLLDYVQHYGIRRRILPDGEEEPPAPWHCWNAAHPITGAMVLNRARHSDLHTRPDLAFPELGVPDAAAAPRLPHALPVMCCLALVPPVWQRTMDPLARAWQKRIEAGEVGAAGKSAPVQADEDEDEEIPGPEADLLKAALVRAAASVAAVGARLRPARGADPDAEAPGPLARFNPAALVRRLGAASLRR